MSANSGALPAGHVLNEYRVESLLGAGGFGLTYLATDINLSVKVALKEYLPADCAARAADHTLGPRTPADSDSFNWGLRRFLDEARTLASFRHPNIVRVMRFFEANHTGYMVMEFVEGEPLSTWMSTRRPLPQANMLGIAGPLLEGLEVIHKANYLHRDIKPPNVFMRADGSPVLLDFGSARELKAGGEMTTMVSPGFAPFEQYHSQGRQGPWSDIYALGGVMYWMVTGTKPVEAAARIRNDVMPSAAQTGNAAVYSADFLKAIDWALKSHEDERPKSAAEFRQALGIGVARGSGAFVNTQPSQTASVRSAREAAAGGMTTIAASGVFDRDTLKRVETELARHLGPIAAVVVRNAARRAATYEDLCKAAVREITDEKARSECLRKLAASDAAVAVRTSPSAVPPAAAAETAQPISVKFPPATLLQAESALAQHIGAVAKVIVRRAAAKARDEAELYLLIADEIKDPAEKKAFVRKAVMASRTR
jgi:hypothetical protein